MVAKGEQIMQNDQPQEEAIATSDLTKDSTIEKEQGEDLISLDSEEEVKSPEATVVVVVVVVVKGLPRPDPPEWSAQGSTPHLADIVLGRCFGYTQLLRPELRDKDCQKIWDAFKNAFISKSPCNITEDDYQPLLKLANQTLPCNKTLLWSKTNVLAHQYSRVQGDMLTLEDTLLGYLADGLMWCGDASSSEINYKSCPDWRKDCSNNPQSVFWKTISQSLSIVLSGQLWSFKKTEDEIISTVKNTDMFHEQKVYI
ncbi:ADP-ribosyl cyclase 1 [Tupaia chinensis]|uniref:ADP-ribosyl cyclase/cyclic ADP-ribose hydrolase 1 n=1 Tax=Tupaia chinensis TaxID=246437 RepID=L9L189_TUPCH|nr:ADP-ribosyl cyclase 1 [Tupaia chinensis]